MVLPCLPDPPRYLFPRRSGTTTSATRLPSRITSTVNTKTSALSSLFRLFARHLAATPSLPRYVLSDTMPPSSREILIPTFFLLVRRAGANWGEGHRGDSRGFLQLHPEPCGVDFRGHQFPGLEQQPLLRERRCLERLAGLQWLLRDVAGPRQLNPDSPDELVRPGRSQPLHHDWHTNDVRRAGRWNKHLVFYPNHLPVEFLPCLCSPIFIQLDDTW